MRIPLPQSGQVVARAPASVRYVGGSDLPAQVTLQEAGQVSRAGNAINDQQQEIWAKQKNQFDTAQVFQANAQLQDSVNKYIENMQQNQQGFNAQNADQEFSDWFQKERDQIGQTLTNPQQQQAFNQSATALGVHGSARATAWKIAQTQSAQDESYKALTATSVQTASQDPTQYGASIAHITSATQALAATRGYDAQTTKALVQQAQSQVATGTALTLAQKSPAMAAQFLKDHGDLLSPRVTAKVQSLIDSANLKAEYDNGMRQLNMMSPDEQQTYLEGVADPKMRMMLQNTIANNNRFAEEQKNQAENDALSGAEKMFVAGQPLDAVMHSPNWDAMSGPGQLRLVQLYSARAKAGGDGFATSSTPQGLKAYAQLLNDGANGMLNQEALLANKAQLTKPQYTKLQNLAVENTAIPMAKLQSFWTAVRPQHPGKGAPMDEGQITYFTNFAEYAQNRAKSGENEPISMIYSDWVKQTNDGKNVVDAAAYSEAPPDTVAPVWDAAASYISGMASHDPQFAQAIGAKPGLNITTLRDHLYGQMSNRIQVLFSRNGIAMTPLNLAAYIKYRSVNPTAEISLTTLRHIKESMLNAAYVTASGASQ